MERTFMRRMPAAILAGLILAGRPTPLWSQGPALAIGARVRVTTTDAARPRVGTWQGMDASALRLGVDTSTAIIPRSTVRLLEESLGRKASVGGAIGGALFGIAAGGALGCLANKDSYGVYCAGQDDTKVIVGAALGGVLGGVAGALIFRKERWRPVPGVGSP